MIKFHYFIVSPVSNRSLMSCTWLNNHETKTDDDDDYSFTAIATAAMQMLGGKEVLTQCRTDHIMADAAYVVLTRDSRARTGEFLIDEDVLRDVGVTDFEPYSCVPGS